MLVFKNLRKHYFYRRLQLLNQIYLGHKRRKKIQKIYTHIYYFNFDKKKIKLDVFLKFKH